MPSCHDGVDCGPSRGYNVGYKCPAKGSKHAVNNTSEAINTQIGQSYEPKGYCYIAGSVGSHITCPCNGEWDQSEGNGCYYLNTPTEGATGCDFGRSGCNGGTGCCGIAGKRLKCTRKAYNGDAKECCLTPGLTTTNNGQLTCDPKYHNQSSDSCTTPLASYCSTNINDWLDPKDRPQTAPPKKSAVGVNYDSFTSSSVKPANVACSYGDCSDACKTIIGWNSARNLSGISYQKMNNECVSNCKKLYQKDWTSSSGGNASERDGKYYPSCIEIVPKHLGDGVSIKGYEFNSIPQNYNKDDIQGFRYRPWVKESDIYPHKPPVYNCKEVYNSSANPKTKKAMTSMSIKELSKKYPINTKDPRGIKLWDNFRELCSENPDACDLTLSDACKGFTRDQIADAAKDQYTKCKSGEPCDTRNLATLCACHLSPNEYKDYNGILDKKSYESCDPLCITPGSIPKTSNGKPVTCKENVCIIDHVTVDILNSKTGDVNLNQACPGCKGGDGQGCFCYFRDINILSQGSTAGHLNIKQDCGKCFKITDDPSNPQPVDCKTGKPITKTKSNRTITTTDDDSEQKGGNSTMEKTGESEFFNKYKIWIIAGVVVLILIFILWWVGTSGKKSGTATEKNNTNTDFNPNILASINV